MPLINVLQPDNIGPRATQKQTNWIASLFIDCQFNLTQQKDYLNGRYGVRYADELTIRQASLVIDDLKCRKTQEKLPLEAAEESEE